LYGERWRRAKKGQLIYPQSEQKFQRRNKLAGIGLISCNGCGIVLDERKLSFPCNIYNNDGSVNEELAEWDGEDFVPKTKCPVCGASILKEIE
jgi:hypothetical protein